MKNWLKCTLLMVSFFIATPVFASNQHVLQIGPYFDYLLPSNQPQIFSNIFRWTIYAECSIIKGGDENKLTFKILRKTGTLNDITLSRGESLTINLMHQEKFLMIAVPGAAVEITNESDLDVVARCSAIADPDVKSTLP